MESFSPLGWELFFSKLPKVGSREALTLALCLLLPLLVIVRRQTVANQRRNNNKKEDTAIPWAPNHSFLLGHALLYKKDPPGFLVRSQQAVGPLFRINLLGRKMIVVGADTALQTSMARQTESTLSSHQAIAQVGL